MGKIFEGEFIEHHPPIQFRILRKLVFLLGDLRWLGLNKFPFCLGWYSYQDEIDLNEVIEEAIPLLEPGDIILHRDDGFVSNLFIGGAMIHAGLYIGDGQVVEAISEGVVRRNCAHILYSDKACILRPKIDQDKILLAIEWAKKIIGFGYDYLFYFNGEESRKLILKDGINARNDGVRFCCTEVPYFCYLDYLPELGIFRKTNENIATKLLSLFGMRAGTAVIDADMYVSSNMELVWCSRSLTENWCQKMGCSEEFIYKIKTWWNKK